MTSPTHVLPTPRPGPWTPPDSYGTGIAGSSGSPHADVGARLEGSTGVVRLRGRINTTGGVSYTGGATIATLPEGLRPEAEQVLNMRSGGTGAANGFLTITAAGVMSFSSNISLTGAQVGWWQLDHLTFPVA